MSDIKIRKITPKRNGVDGMVIDFSKVDLAGDGVKYNNEYDTTFKMPVSSGFRDCWNSIKGHVINVLNLDPELDEDDMRILWVSCNARNEISVSVSIKGFHGKWYTANMPAVCSVEEYSQYDSMVEIVDQIWVSTLKYIVGDAVAQPKQYIMDLFADNESRGKENKFDFELEDVEDMTEAELLGHWQSILEQKGMIVLEPALVDGKPVG
jgi:hypothetical protein